MYPLFTKVTYMQTFPLCLFGVVPQNYMRYFLLYLSPYFAPNKT